MKKSEKFEIEQKEILEKIYNLLEINENNKSFILYEIEKDKNKINEILSLKDDARKYFNAGNWSIFQNYENKREEKEYIILIRGILKALNKEYIATSIKVKENEKWINTRKYVIINL